MNIELVLEEIRPGAEWSLTGDEYDGLDWHDQDQTKPTEDEITNAWGGVEIKITALREILRLETLETPRRLAEAILISEGESWLQTNRDLIATERDKLQ